MTSPLDTPTRRKASLILTVKNDAKDCAVTLLSLTRQSRQPDEIIVVDGGSMDNTREMVTSFTPHFASLKLLDAPGANIARGRNIGTAEATNEIIVTTDAGCEADCEWLAHMVRPFEENPAIEFVAGTYCIQPQSLLEHVVGLATMRGQLDPFDPKTFNPSARSMAYTKGLWSRAGGWPEWLRFSEDTLFDHKVRALGAQDAFAAGAVVHWRPRRSLRSIARQFYNYGTGRGHTGLAEAEFIYNLRNLAFVTGSVALSALWPKAAALTAALVAYFYWWAFHHRALRITQAARKRIAYPLCFVVYWTVLFSNLAGFLIGRVQRFCNPQRFAGPLRAYFNDVSRLPMFLKGKAGPGASPKESA